jgi:predicted kinase
MMDIHMPKSPASNTARLILVCGLPGAGKTTHAKALESQFHAVRFAPDEWMSALAVNIYDESARSRIEQLQWSLCERLLTLGLSVIVEWGTWAQSERDTLRQRARELGALSNCITSSHRKKFCSKEFGGVASRTRPSTVKPWRNGASSSKFLRSKRRPCTTQ